MSRSNPRSKQARLFCFGEVEVRRHDRRAGKCIHPGMNIINTQMVYDFGKGALTKVYPKG
jgi:hypothetical protein